MKRLLSLFFLLLSIHAFGQLPAGNCGEFDSTRYANPTLPGGFTYYDWEISKARSLYLAGTIEEMGVYKLALIKIDSSGNLLWQDFYDPIGEKNPFKIALGLDNNGNAYVLDMQPANNSIVHLTKIGTNGDFQFRKELTPKQYVTDIELKVLENSNPVITIAEREVSNIQYPSWIVFQEFNSNGEVVFADTIGDGTNNDSHEFLDLKIKENESTILSRSYDKPLYGIALNNYSTQSKNWSKIFSNPGSNFPPYGNIYLASDTLSGVINYNKHLQFIKVINGDIILDTTYADLIKGSFHSSNGSDQAIYLNSSKTTDSTNSAYLYKFSFTGKLLWQKEFSTPANNNFEPNFSATSDGYVYLVRRDSFNFYDAIEKLIRIHPDGHNSAAITVDTLNHVSNLNTTLILKTFSNQLYLFSQRVPNLSFPIYLPTLYVLDDLVISKSVYMFKPVTTKESINDISQINDENFLVISDASYSAHIYQSRISSIHESGAINWIYEPDIANHYFTSQRAAFDIDSNIYTIGSLHDSSNFYGIPINLSAIKLDKNGNELWNTVIDTFFTYNTQVWDAIVDSQKNLYICGTFRDLFGDDMDAFLLKITKDGEIAFVEIYDDNENEQEGFYNILKVNQNEVKIAGTEYKGYYFYHYSSSGVLTKKEKSYEAEYFTPDNSNKVHIPTNDAYIRVGIGSVIRETRIGHLIWKKDLKYFSYPSLIDHAVNTKDSIFYIAYHEFGSSQIAIEAFSLNGNRIWDRLFPSGNIKMHFSDRGLYLILSNNAKTTMNLLNDKTGKSICTYSINSSNLQFGTFKSQLSKDSTLIVFLSRTTNLSSPTASEFVEFFKWTAENENTGLNQPLELGDKRIMMNLYPNPAAGQVSIQLTKNASWHIPLKVRFIALSGEVQREFPIPLFGKKFRFDLPISDSVNDQYYLVTLVDAETGQTIATEKLLIH